MTCRVEPGLSTTRYGRYLTKLTEGIEALACPDCGQHFVGGGLRSKQKRFLEHDCDPRARLQV